MERENNPADLLRQLRGSISAEIHHLVYSLLDGEQRGELLGYLIRTEIIAKGGFIPQGAWDAYQKMGWSPYLEVAIVRKFADIWKILLTRRDADDPHFPGELWHIPGGLWRVPSSVEHGCLTIACRELGIESLRYVTKLDWQEWHDHPYGYPISHVVLCQTDNSIQENERVHFFTWHELSQKEMVKHHYAFAKTALHHAMNYS